jgi:hypothetical protein
MLGAGLAKAPGDAQSNRIASLTRLEKVAPQGGIAVGFASIRVCDAGSHELCAISRIAESASQSR